MPRKTSARVVLNRQALNEVGLAVADGLEEVVRSIVLDAHPPDATPYGAGLVTSGGWLVYHGSKKVAGGSLTGKQPKKPRAVRVMGIGGITAIAGFGFPGRFQEIGTIYHRAQPFLGPSLMRHLGRIPQIMAPATRARLQRQVAMFGPSR